MNKQTITNIDRGKKKLRMKQGKMKDAEKAKCVPRNEKKENGERRAQKETVIPYGMMLCV